MQRTQENSVIYWNVQVRVHKITTSCLYVGVKIPVFLLDGILVFISGTQSSIRFTCWNQLFLCALTFIWVLLGRDNGFVSGTCSLPSGGRIESNYFSGMGLFFWRLNFKSSVSSPIISFTRNHRNSKPGRLGEKTSWGTRMKRNRTNQ